PQSAVIVRAKITAPGGVTKPLLFFRTNGAYVHLPLLPKGAGKYEAQIPAKVLQGALAVEYYLTATGTKDRAQGFWYAEATPYKLEIPPPKKHGVHVMTKPPRATVEIDGEPMGPAPFISQLDPGPHRATATLVGYLPQAMKFQMPPGKEF